MLIFSFAYDQLDQGSLHGQLENAQEEQKPVVHLSIHQPRPSVRRRTLASQLGEACRLGSARQKIRDVRQRTDTIADECLNASCVLTPEDASN
jgi:hypothetical protein